MGLVRADDLPAGLLSAWNAPWKPSPPPTLASTTAPDPLLPADSAAVADALRTLAGIVTTPETAHTPPALLAPYGHCRLSDAVTEIHTAFCVLNGLEAKGTHDGRGHDLQWRAERYGTSWAY